MRSWRRWAAAAVIMLIGIAMLALLLVRPQIMSTAAAVYDGRNVKLVWEDLHYDRRMKLIQADLDALRGKRYSALFLSMYPIETYDESLISHWRGLEIFKAQTTAENGRELAGALAYLLEQGTLPDLVLLGLDPECLGDNYPLRNSLLKALDQTPDTVWEILLASPSISYWRGKGDGEWQAALDRYEEAVRLLVREDNVKLYYACDREWLVCNDGNYVREKIPAENAARALLGYYTGNQYLLTVENMEQSMASARDLIARWRSGDRHVDGLQGKTLVFMGDSTFGHYTDSLAITGVVEEFTDARVVNCGYGGMTGTYGEISGATLGDLLDAIEAPDGFLSGEGVGGQPALDALPELRQLVGAGENVVFFLDYGINDYIGALPLRGEDDHDAHTYVGAMRTAIERLQEMFEGSRIVLVTPHFIRYNNNGNNPVGEAGNVYADYVEAVRELAGEYALPILDFYGELGIGEDNWQERLGDEVHPNEASRFDMGMAVLELLKKMFPPAGQ